MISRTGWLVAVGLLLTLTPRVNADLDAYVKRPDPSFAWKVVETRSLPEGTATQITLTSQTWDGIRWTHDLQVYEPVGVAPSDAMLLFITGGANRVNQPPFRNLQEGFAMAAACGARVAVLPQVPNQPLLDGKVEDDLIAETFVRYLKTKNEDLPLLQPMVKSAVRAMDAVQEWARSQDKPVPSRFVVSGASKRGWTTWLTAAVDPRVAAIAPMVIPTLNMKAQNKHQIDTWGRYSEQIDDYVRRGLMERIDEPEGQTLWRLIDPYTYRDRLTMPKLQINGTNDPYWTLDSLNLYWDDLKGPSHVVYLPNAVHNLQEHRDWAINGVGALFRLTVAGKTLPTIDLTRDGGQIRVRAESAPREIRVWVARSKTRDFRASRWEVQSSSTPAMPGDATMTAALAPEPGEFLAAFFDLTYEIDGLTYHLSTPITIMAADGLQP